MSGCDSMISKFENHIGPDGDIIWEREKGNVRQQEEHDIAGALMTDLHKLASSPRARTGTTTSYSAELFSDYFIKCSGVISRV